MPIYKKPEDKAVETVTFRLTLDERRMLDHLSTVEQMTLTDFIRSLITKRAMELNITEVPPPKPRRRPGRPKTPKSEPTVHRIEQPIGFNDVIIAVASDNGVPRSDSDQWSVADTEEHSILESSEFESTPEVIDNTDPDRTHLKRMQSMKPETISPASSSIFAKDKEPPMFGDLVLRFKSSFAHRAEGTKRELEETIRFLCLDGRDGHPIIPQDTPISELTVDRLSEIRQTIRDAEVRLAKKNLYLTYLRMMLHFGTKETDFDLRINPSRELPPLSIVESPDRRRFFTGMTE